MAGPENHKDLCQWITSTGGQWITSTGGHWENKIPKIYVQKTEQMDLHYNFPNREEIEVLK